MEGGGGSVRGFRADRFRAGMVVGSAGVPVTGGVGVSGADRGRLAVFIKGEA